MKTLNFRELWLYYWVCWKNARMNRQNLHGRSVFVKQEIFQKMNVCFDFAEQTTIIPNTRLNYENPWTATWCFRYRLVFLGIASSPTQSTVLCSRTSQLYSPKAYSLWGNERLEYSLRRMTMFCVTVGFASEADFRLDGFETEGTKHLRLRFKVGLRAGFRG